MPYEKKPAPEHLSPRQKKDWEMNEQARYEKSLAADVRTFEQIAPAVPVESLAPPKKAEETAKAGEARAVQTAEDIVKALQEKKDRHPTKYFK